MKNYKKWDYTIPLVIMIILTAFLCSCGNNHEVINTSDAPKKVIVEQANLADTRYSILVIDSCEYIVYAWATRDDHVITHKGNCKFCTERTKQLLKK
jgi:hypothetical protein